MTEVIAIAMIAMMVLGVVGLFRACRMACTDSRKKEVERQELSVSRNRKVRE